MGSSNRLNLLVLLCRKVLSSKFDDFFVEKFGIYLPFDLTQIYLGILFVRFRLVN